MHKVIEMFFDFSLHAKVLDITTPISSSEKFKVRYRKVEDPNKPSNQKIIYIGKYKI